MSIWLQKSALIQERTSLLKFEDHRFCRSQFGSHTERLVSSVNRNVFLRNTTRGSACNLNCDLENLRSSNFKRLVIVCIETDFCNQILIGKRLTRSTISVIFSRPNFSKIQLENAPKFCKFLKKHC